MSKLFSLLSILVISASMAIVTAPSASAQSRTGIGVADIQQAVNRSDAMMAAQAEVERVHADAIARHDARAAELQAEVDNITEQMRAELNKPTPSQTRIQQLNTARQAQANAAREELAQINAPYTRAISYAREQVALSLNEAMGNAMRRLQVDLLLQPSAVLRIETHVNVTDAITADLNALVSSVSITPPDDYTPGQILQQANAANAAAAAGESAPDSR